jgi:formylglycine-generating enzyme required for sulfatase activity
MRFGIVLAWTALLIVLGMMPGYADKRVALVVGNNRYANLPTDQQLRKAVNDARAVGDVLDRLGFDVIRGEDLDRRGLVDKLDELSRRLTAGDTVFFYFSGHGVSLVGGNYILPSDVPNVEPGQETRLARAALSESDIVADLQDRGVRIAVVVLDACRSNPFRRGGTRTIGAESGLHERGIKRVDSVSGLFTFYSAGLGQAALDRLGDSDANPNSIFTRVLLPALAKPGLDLSALAVEVREEVARLARTVGHDQRPAYYDETIGGKVYLAGLGAAPGADEVAWSFVKDTNEPAQLRRFLEQFPTSTRQAAAASRLAEIENEQKVGVIVSPAYPAASSSAGTIASPVMPITPPPAIDPCKSAVIVSLTSRCPAPLSAAEEHRLTPKESFKECDPCPEMVVVRAGSFTMGSPASEVGRDKDEGPQHVVTISKPFAVGRFPVTFEEWDACVEARGCNGYRPRDEGWGRGRRPVINVSWNDAKLYVEWLSNKTGKNYRLLSEAEREYVTRAGATSPFWWGSSISTQQANYLGNFTYRGSAKGENRNQTLAVDTLQPNPWGLYHVHGNVLDWTEDCYHDNYIQAPSDGSAWTSGDCTRRVLRGGSWAYVPGNLRAAYRIRASANDRDENYGFRLGRVLTP